MSVGHFYLKSVEKVFSAQIDFTADTFKCLLTTGDYAYDQAVDEFRADVTDEIVDGSYTAGGVVVTGVALSDDGSTIFRIDCDDPFFAGLNATDVLYGVLYKDTGDDATDPLICIVILNAPESPTGDWSLVIPTEGIIAVGAS